MSLREAKATSQRQIRLQAAREGKRRYEGLPCKKNPEHGNERYTVNGACVLCVKGGSANFTTALRAMLKK